VSKLEICSCAGKAGLRKIGVLVGAGQRISWYVLTLGAGHSTPAAPAPCAGRGIMIAGWKRGVIEGSLREITNKREEEERAKCSLAEHARKMRARASCKLVEIAKEYSSGCKRRNEG